ncbi:MAG TPA: sortase [Acidimicrobiales bacterium]|nr:sortase [Acidimicrobiales bacterium]
MSGWSVTYGKPPPRTWVSWARVVVGVALVWGALGVLGYRLGWESHSHNGQAKLLQSERASMAHTSGATCAQGAQSAPTSDGQLTGVLVMSKLGVTAPVEQGTGDDVLNVSVGHADSTPLPGTAGTSVLLAHDVSYFANVDQLVPGDVVEYASGCAVDKFEVTSHEVVAAGSAIPQLGGDALVLDTCWPTNALWYTPNRYLVEATETSVSSGRSAASAPKTWVTGYTTAAPPALVAQGLDLTSNEAPMGTLQLNGSPDSAWAQSPAPLAVEAAGLAAYFGGLHSADQGRSDWWTDIAPGVAMPAPLEGAWVSGHDAPLDVTITADGDTPTAVVLGTVLTLSGGPAPGEYREQVTEAVHGLDVSITNWEVDHV